MANKWTAEKACKKVLTTIRRSNLHFVMRETPFSAEVTIRKKFVKSFQTIFTNNDIGIKNSSNKEVQLLNNKIATLEVELNKMRKQFENINTKYEQQKMIKEDKETELEYILKENHLNKMKAEGYCKDNADMRQTLNQILTENRSFEHNNNDQTEEYKEIYDQNGTAWNANVDRKPLNYSDLSCLNSDFKESKVIGTPKDTNVRFKCEDCEQRFITKEEQEIHLCKIVLKNPTFDNLYIQKVHTSKQCSPIFSRENKREIAFLHSDGCWNLSSYCKNLPSWFFGEPLRDKCGILHLKLSDFVTKGTMNWVGLYSEMMETIHVTWNMETLTYIPP